MKPTLLLVTHGLIANQDGLTLHPDLLLWQASLLKRKQQWFDCSPKNPLAMYAAILGTEPALLLASKLDVNAAKQYWLASPYHAQLSRDSVRVMPEGMLPWCEEDAVWACDLLNPLLAEESMQLYNIGAALILACDQSWHATPPVFADIAGKSLPNQHPEGVDGGRLMRLMSEMQMMFKQSPARHRRERAEVDVHGLWLWGGCEVSKQKLSNVVRAVASRDPCLRTLIDARDAELIISEPEQLDELMKQGEALPKQVVLLGEGYAVLLKRSLMPKLTGHKWLPKAVRSEAELFQLL